jgi:2-oxoglutarate decarboxylase
VITRTTSTWAWRSTCPAERARSLVVVSIKGCEAMNFAQFWSAYEAIVHKARTGALNAEDYAGTTLTLTNPGTLGTNHSVPRLMQGQGTIVGVGAMEYPAEFQGASEERPGRDRCLQDHHPDLDL